MLYPSTDLNSQPVSMNQAPKIHRRVFIVGCPRSGTTLLQSMFAAHPNVHSFPETHFFCRAISRNVVRRALNLPSRSFDKYFSILADEAGIDRDMIPADIKRWKLSNIVEFFISCLDELTLQKNCTMWLEKTPAHLHCINFIQKQVENCTFIHLVRDGRGAIASLYDAALKYPNEWKRIYSLERCVSRWTDDINISRSYLARNNHVAVVYKDLITNPTVVLNELCDVIGLPFSSSMLDRRTDTVASIISSGEYWKSGVYNGIFHNNADKFDKIFDSDQKSYILEKIEPFNIDKMFPR